MNVKYTILINTKEDAEGRNISMCDGYTAGDPLTQAWQGTHNTLDQSDFAICEELFETFNINHPAGYRNRSLSKGDVVVLEQNYGVRAYAVASVGFEKIENPIPSFIKAVRDHARKNYTVDGWDYVVESLDNDELQDIIGDAKTEKEAIKRVGARTKTWNSMREDARQS